MVVRMPMSADVLGRSRFGVSPCVEVVGSVRTLHREEAARSYLARWRERALRSVPQGDLELLTALVPPAGYAPDLLTPPPAGSVVSAEDETATVAATEQQLVGYQLDIAFRGRRIPPEVGASFGGAERLESSRRPMPRVVADALDGGYEAFAARAAAAMLAYFDHVLAPEWDHVLDVLSADIAYRGDRMARHGALALLDDLHPDLSWKSGAVVLRRPFSVEVDWADDGLLLIPSAATGGRVWFNAERPTTPSVIYPARGTQQLWDVPETLGPDDVGDLLGHTRATLLAALDRPRTTAELGRTQALTASTVSYHLGILHRSGLVSRRRTGRRVVYARTELAAALMRR